MKRNKSNDFSFVNNITQSWFYVAPKLNGTVMHFENKIDQILYYFVLYKGKT